MRKVRIGFLLAMFLVALIGAQAGAQGGKVHVLTAKGAINPVLAGYLERGLKDAADEGATAVVIQMDTPGGLDTSMRDIIQAILNSPVPVIVYVAPQGARAASAGAFITMAAHVAAMAPNTAIGAAHPVNIGGEVDATMTEKVTNDAAAYIKSLAVRRGRNVEWAERAVRESVSAHEGEALAMGVVDMVAPDLASLLAQADGRRVELFGNMVTLRTAGSTVVHHDMGWVERFLYTISDPNIAYILLSLAMTGLFLELANPGAILPGVVGGICLLLAFYSLGTLPVNYAGVLLIVLAFVFFIAEIFVTTHGMLAFGGIASLTLGSLILFNSSAPYLAIDRRLIAVVVLSVTAFFVFVVGAVARAHRRQVTTGREGLVGKVAVVRAALNPEGLVFLEGERWKARLEEGEAEPGEEVVVTKMDGLRLIVTKRS